MTDNLTRLAALTASQSETDIEGWSIETVRTPLFG
jgi:hypothetical protein